MKKFIGMILCIVMLIFLFPTEAAHAEAYDENGEVSWFPAYTINLSQLAYEGYSHSEQNAIDILPGGNVFAPFSGKIVYTDSNWGYVMLQSKDKVQWADGSYDYMSVGFMHDSDISDLWVGKEIKQGEEFYQAGGMGDGNPNAYGAHVHITVHRGQVERGWPYGNGDAYAYDAFFINPQLTTKTEGRGYGYAVSRMANNSPSDYSELWKIYDGYLSKCRFYNTYGTVNMTGTGWYKTLPCSKNTFEDSKTLRKSTKKDVVTVTGLYQNTVGNYWYRIELDGETAYIFAGDAKQIDFRFDDVKISNVSSPSRLNVGDRFSIKGNITSKYNIIENVCAEIRTSDGQQKYFCRDSINAKSYDLLNSKIDMAMLFNELPAGDYIYEVFAEISPSASDDGKKLYSSGSCVTLINQKFTVG